MFKELSKVEQRYQAVMCVLVDGLLVTEVAEKFGVSRQTVHSWLRRYEAGGLDGLADRSHRPVSCPHRMPAEVEARVCELRRERPYWGPVRIEMQFLADVFVPCDQCDGKRFKPQVLEVRYRGRTIHQVLDLTVREALTFFSSSPKVLRRLQVLDEIGLGYLRLGQPATTLSGGEAQRIKIAAHLSSHSGERLLYILDEPTTGLHFDDIAKLLTAFRKLLEAGNTLIVIEHNLDVIKTADYIIDLGPEGGEDGGRLSRRDAGAGRAGRRVAHGTLSSRPSSPKAGRTPTPGR